MSAIPSEDILDQTEIVFSVLPTLDATIEESNVTEEAPEQSELPQHVEYLKNKLKLQQRRKKIISEEESRLANLNRALANTESLNGETQQLNVQAAVLMGALNKLQQELQQASSAKDSLLEEISTLKKESLSIKADLAQTQGETSSQV
ncbi:MAG: hypothetical protein GKR91_01565 [Pseudomonadales bacterium]|nr:hypothetical protein [Pseudomonadales bacterium]